MGSYNGIIDSTSLNGVISNNISLDGIISNNGSLVGIVSNELFFDVQITEGNTGYEPYKGCCEVCPTAFYGQVLETKNKYIPQDIVVKEIPYEVAPNEYGTTVSISS